RHVMEIGRVVGARQRIERVERLRGAIERGLGGSGSDTGRVGEGDEAGPLRGAGAGAADHEPALLALIAGGVVDGYTRFRIAIISDVGSRSLRAALGDVALVAWFGDVLADAAAAEVPRRLRPVTAVAVQRQRRAADTHDARRDRWPLGSGAAVAGRGHEGH